MLILSLEIWICVVQAWYKGVLIPSQNQISFHTPSSLCDFCSQALTKWQPHI
jgi:hypothetical protein